MRVGDYVRTKDGVFGKIIDRYKIDDYYKIKVDIRNGWIEKHKENLFKKHIIKSSPNIIDLIEEHDLLKIEYKISDESIQTEVVEVIRNYQGILYVNTFVGKFFVKDLEHYDRKILSIVTKEQFSAMEYKVESEVK